MAEKREKRGERERERVGVKDSLFEKRMGGWSFRRAAAIYMFMYV